MLSRHSKKMAAPCPAPEKPLGKRRAQTVMVDEESGRMKVRRAPTLEAACAGTPEAILNETTAEIMAELTRNPHKVLITARWIKNESNFVISKKVVNKDWWHGTIIYFRSVSKEFWIETLLEYQVRRSKGASQWDEKILRKVDRAHGLHGIEYLVKFLSQTNFNEAFPAAMRYKPLMKEVMIQQMLYIDNDVCVDRKTFRIDYEHKGVFEFGDATNGVYTTIVHRKSGVRATIPEDYTVRVGSNMFTFSNNWLWTDAVVAGRRGEEKVMKIFAESSAETPFEWDVEQHYTNECERLKPMFDEAMKESKRRLEDEQAAASSNLLSITGPGSSGSAAVPNQISTGSEKQIGTPDSGDEAVIPEGPPVPAGLMSLGVDSGVHV